MSYMIFIILIIQNKKCTESYEIKLKIIDKLVSNFSFYSFNF